MNALINEKKITARLSGGDTNALAEIIKAYTGYVGTVARNFSRGLLTKEDIEEITADAFFRLWNAREKLDADIGIRSFLSAITRNLVRDRFRKLPPPTDDISELEIPSGFIAEDEAELRETLSCLYEGLETLSRDEREIFYRFYFNGEKASRIAEEKGMTKAAVDMRLSRTRSKLRKFLTERGFYHA